MNKNTDNHPSGSTPAPGSSANKKFMRTQSVRLPTPPPDPTQSNDQLDSLQAETSKAALEKENEFLEYLNSLPTPGKSQADERPSLQRTGSIFAPAMAAEDAFDHLDKLYKLMEQLLNLREQNAKLQRRVRDLEHLRNLQNMDRQVTRKILRGEEAEVPDLDDDSVLAEALLDNMFTSGRYKRSTKHKSPSQFRFRQSILRPQRDRSSSLAVDDLGRTVQGSLPRNSSGKSLPESAVLRKPSKVSKWTKVKAAFKWEKASPTVSGAKSQDSGIGGMVPVNTEVARYLRVPSTCDNPNDAGTSPADSVLSGSWQGVHGLSTPGSISPASSTDELNPSTNSEHRSVSRTGSAGHSNASGIRFRTSRTSDEDDGDRRSRSLDYTGAYSCDSSTAINKDELLKLHSKSHKTPWGKVKDIIQIRKDSLRKKQHRLSARSDDLRTDYSAGSDQEDVFEPLATPTVTVTATEDDPPPTINTAIGPSHAAVVGTGISSTGTGRGNDDVHKIPADVLARYQRVAAEEDRCLQQVKTGSPKSQRRISKWTRVKKAFLTSASVSRSDEDRRSHPSSPINKNSQFFTDTSHLDWKSYESKIFDPTKSSDDLQSRKLKEEIHKNYEQLQKKLSQEFQDKLNEWEKVKINSGQSASSSLSASQTSGAAGGTEEQHNPEFIRKMEEWERIKNQNSSEPQKRRNLQLTSEENLPADFKKKLQEWNKIKKFGGKEEDLNTSNSRKKKTEWQLWRSNSKQESTSPDGRQYSEDFLKKLDEWKQIKASNSASEDQQEHRKSLKENKSPSPGLTRNSSSNKLMRQSKKHKMQEWLEKELQKIEREKQRLEREREKFLEREERLAKLRRSIGNNPHKKDVLVQTSTGFYRFEGISRKFTQRLYEWEKARGIGPEDSTFALLSAGYNQLFPHPARSGAGNSYRHNQLNLPKLTRSKSMDSVANLTCGGSLITHQPSSLSLNDVEELEMQCLTESPSERQLHESEDHLDYGEPEAVLVEVEDFVEETAAPLEEGVRENRHTPVYHTEETATLCESEKCEAPLVRRSESAKALSNYNLIQESLTILNKMRDNEQTCKETEAKMNDNKQLEPPKNTGAIPKRKKNLNQPEHNNESLQSCLNNYYTEQSEMSQGLISKILLLQDANTTITKNVSTENTGYTISHLNDTLSITQDLSAELVLITEKLKSILSERREEFISANKESNSGTNTKYGQDISEMVDLLIIKIKELKRSLSYLCAASDMTAPGRRKKGSYKDRRNLFHKRASLDQISIAGSEKTLKNDNTSDEEEDDRRNDKTKCPRRKDRLVKSKSEDNQIINYAKLQVTSVGDLRKERTERCYQLNRPSCSTSQTQLASQMEPKSEVNNTENHRKNRCQRKLLRTRRISDSMSDSNKDLDKSTSNKCEDQTPNEHNLNTNVIIPTNIQYLDVTSNTADNPSTSSPVSVFVHTTRKVFTPFASEIFEKKSDEANNNGERLSPPKIEESVDHRNKLLRRSHSPSNSPLLPRKRRNTTQEEQTTEPIETMGDNQTSRPSTPSYLPPLPNSPIAQRRERHLTKETSPAIRLMIARYNQKLFEQDTPGNKSAGSSGSASPVAWRSPVFERRVKAQTEKYQEEVNKPYTSRCSPLFMRKQVQKSASVGVINPDKKQVTSPEGALHGASLENSSPKLIRGILKSTSMDSMKTKQLIPKPETSGDITSTPIKPKPPSLKLSIPPPRPDSFKRSPVLEERAHKIQKAKEEFLQISNTPIEGVVSAPPIFDRNDQTVKYPARNRLSQVSVGSESSCDDLKCSGLLVKSASAGMINVDEATYQQFKPEIHTQGYVSLPRATKKKDGKFGISTLASKFRKVKMRRSKDPTQMNTISTLCRQSLVVDITTGSQENINEQVENETNKKKDLNERGSSSDIQSPSTSKSSWIKNPTKIFKPK